MTNDELNTFVHTLSHRIARCLEKQGVLERDAENTWLTIKEEEGDVLTQPQGASVTYRIATGPQQGLLPPQPVSGTSICLASCHA